MNLFSKSVRLCALLVFGVVLFFEIGCGDTFRPIASPLPTPGGDQQSLDTVSILNCNGTINRTGPLVNCSGTARSTGQLISVGGDTIATTSDLGVAPGFVSYDAARSAFYVPNTTADAVSAVAYSRVGNAGGATFHYESATTTLTLPAGSNPIASFVGATEEYLLNAGSGSVCSNLSIVTISNNAVGTGLCIGTSPSFAVQSGNNLFVLDKASNQVNVYSSQQAKIVATITVGTSPVYATLSFDKKFVYVVNQGSSDITIVDANAFTVVSTVPTGGSGPIRAFLDASLVRLYVLNQGDNTVTSFNAIGNSTLVKLGTATVGPNPVNLTVLTGGNRAFTANSGNNTLTEINTGSFTTKTITIGTDPAATVTDVTSSVDGSKLYAGLVTPGNLNNGVTVIRTTDDAVVNTLRAPNQDAACVTSTTTTCALQQPQQFMGGR